MNNDKRPAANPNTVNPGLEQINTEVQALQVERTRLVVPEVTSPTRQNLANFRHNHPFVPVFPITHADTVKVDGTNSLDYTIPDGTKVISFLQGRTGDVTVSFWGRAVAPAAITVGTLAAGTVTNGALEFVNPGLLAGTWFYVENKTQISISGDANALLSILSYQQDDLIFNSSGEIRDVGFN